ncbi:CocE/NonD family hydrolase [Catenulispora sp. GP43]|uniref:CocE/NonD family hydrolase n=1 Tax=Catenulispora sp. GP43 TaxID=3156263 RepID=UPI0035151DE4
MTVCSTDDRYVVGPGWRAEWFRRMERTPTYISTWLAHQRRGAYWRHGSVIEDPSGIKAAVLAVGGWADPYAERCSGSWTNSPRWALPSRV